MTHNIRVKYINKIYKVPDAPIYDSITSYSNTFSSLLFQIFNNNDNTQTKLESSILRRLNL